MDNPTIANPTNRKYLSDQKLSSLQGKPERTGYSLRQRKNNVKYRETENSED